MGILLMLVTIGGLITAMIMLVIAAVTKKAWLAKFTIGGVAVWLVFYAVMLLGFSLASSEKTLSVKEPKAFCGFYLDCHMHAVVAGVSPTKRIGDRIAKGDFYIVAINVFSDAKNPNIAFRLIEPKIVVLDENGVPFPRDLETEALLSTASVDIGQDIRGRQIIQKELVFDLPDNMKSGRLDIREGYGIDHAIEAVLIDDEDSILHKRIYLDISPPVL